MKRIMDGTRSRRDVYKGLASRIIMWVGRTIMVGRYVKDVNYWSTCFG